MQQNSTEEKLLTFGAMNASVFVIRSFRETYHKPEAEWSCHVECKNDEGDTVKVIRMGPTPGDAVTSAYDAVIKLVKVGMPAVGALTFVPRVVDHEEEEVQHWDPSKGEI